jgi:protein-disulfide isomerase
MSEQSPRRTIDVLTNVVVILAAITIAAVVVRREFFQPTQPAEAAGTLKAKQVSASDWNDLLAIRPPNAERRVNLVVFNDLECPFCRRFHTVLRSVEKQFPNDLHVVFVHLPLEMHRFALPSARAAECARSENRFDEIVHVLFEKQDSLGLKSWNSFARDAGIRDTASFNECLSSSTAVEMVDRGIAFADKLQITGTPTVVVNGWRLSFPPPERILADMVGRLVAGERIERIVEVRR